MKLTKVLAGALMVFCGGHGPVVAEPVSVQAVLEPTEQIRLDFKDESNWLVLLVRREGTSVGTGPLAGLTVTEYGIHDIIPGVGGDPRGYLEMTAKNGDVAYIKWQIRAVSVAETNGKTVLLDNGHWECVGGTGRFEDMKGAGVLHIKPVSGESRRFMLTGDIVGAPLGVQGKE
ncbi:MAG: hypothetical protein KIT00_10730 [Rhodospirillales bacterium]|nr:hypothetical protein [Rhodospirillales bacterium]